MKKYKTTCATACLLWLVLLLAALPLGVGAAGQSVTLAHNGVEVEIPLPAAVGEWEQPQPYYALGEIDGVRVTLKLEDSSVAEKARFEERVYTSLAQDHPETTQFEELPDLTQGDATFAVRKLVYAGARGELIAALTAFCRVNHRYIYVVTLQGEGGVDADMLRQFTAHTVATTPYKLDGGILALSAAALAVGLCYILFNWRKKHRWPRAVGTISAVVNHWRWTEVQVPYQRPDGTFFYGTFSTLLWGFPYVNRVGQRVDIAHSPKNPQKVHILSSKVGYGIGVFFLLLAAGGVYLLFFEL